MFSKKGFLIIISAPSGAGKTTIVKKILEDMPWLKYSVSYTTRKPREGEINGVHYNFVSVEEFKKMIAENKLLEWEEVHGNYYGTSKEFVENCIKQGHVVLLDLDVKGALNVKSKMPDTVLIFIMPPNIEELKKRLQKRGTENENELEMRLKTAGWEIEKSKHYDYIVVNDDLNKAIRDVECIIRAETLKNRG